ncbi:TIGR02996 domain-containing protein [bacterium]|nr:TIGR02996 domain-containing protein [bacterium]
MSDEPAFLRAILDAPSLATPRLVYADWLDDQSDPFSARKAEFIRLETHVAGAPERSLDRVQFTGRLHLLSIGLDADWLAVVAHPALESYRLRFQFECPARWDRLTPTADVRVRHCEACDRSVHFCATLDEFTRHATAGECVAVSPALGRRRPPRPTLPVAPIRLTPEMLDRLRERLLEVRIGVAAAPPDPAPPGPGIRPATHDKPDHRPREKRIKSGRTQRSKRVRWDEAEE